METPEPRQARIERATFIRNQIPAGGLFAGAEWRTAPEPFALDADTSIEFETLGRVLLQFYRAANLLYRHSVEGRRPAWIAGWLEQGKPPKIVALQRSSSLKNEIPRVLRPDLLLVDGGMRITELDSVPGGIGLTAWLNQTYSEVGMQVIGGRDGMLRGFASIFGEASVVHIVVSEESATYRPEMEWLAQRLNTLGHCVHVRDTSPFNPADGEAVYRFFEMFDVDQVRVADTLFEAAARKRILLTPPPRSFLEEKLLFALLWNRRLRDYWRQELGGGFYDRLLGLVPYTWVVDPAPMPPQAAVPELNLSDWSELKTLSQRDRELVLKVSGFSSDAWGARGVVLGHDLSAGDWSAAVDRAIESFDRSPYILQRFEKARRVPLNWLADDPARIAEEDGRTRLCPYYFVSGQGDEQRATLGGVLATIVPADKKIIHGMRDAVLAPCSG